MTTNKRGLFISFEGIDGVGKSTQAHKLVKTLSAHGYDVIHTREPGGSPGAEDIRALVLQGDPDRWSAETELLLFTAARRDHIERTVEPALQAGKVVICDRFIDSTRMYQGLRGAGLSYAVDQLHDLMIQVEPDLTVLIDLDPSIGLGRALGRLGNEQRFEDFGLELQEQMRVGFLDLAHKYPARINVVDGSGSLDEVAARIYQVVASKLHTDV